METDVHYWMASVFIHCDQNPKLAFTSCNRGQPTHILHHIGKLYWNQMEKVSIFTFLSPCLLSSRTPYWSTSKYINTPETASGRRRKVNGELHWNFCYKLYIYRTAEMTEKHFLLLKYWEWYEKRVFPPKNKILKKVK